MSGSTKFIRAMGIPRVGNHAVIKMICENAGPRGYIHFNLCPPLKDPLQCHSVETRDGLLRPSNPEHLEKIRGEHDLDSYDLVVFSYEDLFLDAHHALEHRISEPYEDRISHNLFITRSLPNWMASWLQQRLKKAKNNPDHAFNYETNPFFVTEKALRVFRNWLAHMREVDTAIAQGGTGMTGQARNVGAVYDSFYTDPGHRRQIVEQLGLDPVNLDLPEFSTHGGGSSFSGVKVTDPAQLDVADRWSHFRDNPYFVHLMAILWTNDEVRELCFRHFPESSQILDSFLKTGETGALREAV